MKNVLAASSTLIKALNVTDIFTKKTPCDVKTCFVRVKASIENIEIAVTHTWPMYMNKQTIKASDQPNLTWTANAMQGKESTKVEVVVVNNEGAATAIFLTAEAGEIIGYFNKNVLFLVPGE